MADDGSAESPGWPLPAFQFEVTWGGEVMSFQEVSGLASEADPVEYRVGDGPPFSLAMPGREQTPTVTLKRGAFVSDIAFRDWFARIGASPPARHEVTIRLVDEYGKPLMTWTLARAWPTMITGTDLESDGNEVAIESIEISHEGLTISDA